MTGKSKSFIEDTIITVVIVTIIVGFYYFISNNPKIENIKQVINVIHNETNESQNILEANDTNNTQKEIIPIKNEVSKSPKIDEMKVKNINIEKLKKFIKDIKNTLSEQIVYEKDYNSTQSRYLKIRFTLLKSGNYEQLTFVDGDEKIFEKNKEKIKNIFPLAIDKDIIEDFPRYIRIELKEKL